VEKKKEGEQNRAKKKRKKEKVEWLDTSQELGII